MFSLAATALWLPFRHFFTSLKILWPLFLMTLLLVIIIPAIVILSGFSVGVDPEPAPSFGIYELGIVLYFLLVSFYLFVQLHSGIKHWYKFIILENKSQRANFWFNKGDWKFFGYSMLMLTVTILALIIINAIAYYILQFSGHETLANMLLNYYVGGIAKDAYPAEKLQPMLPILHIINYVIAALYNLLIALLLSLYVLVFARISVADEKAKFIEHKKSIPGLSFSWPVTYALFSLFIGLSLLFLSNDTLILSGVISLEDLYMALPETETPPLKFFYPLIIIVLLLPYITFAITALVALFYRERARPVLS